MNQTDADIEKVNEKFIQLSRKYNLNPVLLKEIMIQRNKGLNNIQIAEKTGINKNTVNKYVSALGDMKNNDLMELLGAIAIIVAGAYLLSKLMDILNGGE